MDKDEIDRQALEKIRNWLDLTFPKPAKGWAYWIPKPYKEVLFDIFAETYPQTRLDGDRIVDYLSATWRKDHSVNEWKAALEILAAWNEWRYAWDNRQEEARDITEATETNQTRGLGHEYAYAVGRLCENANNPKDAIQWYVKAAHLGSVDAVIALGKHYEKAENYEEAIKWYLRQADTSDAINRCYHKGLGVARNKHNILEWQRHLAGCGVADAAYDVGVHCARVGNYEDAIFHFRLAQHNGHRGAAAELAQAKEKCERAREYRAICERSKRISEVPEFDSDP